MAEADPVWRHKPARTIFFERAEFDTILGLYGRGLAAGTWRDYAIDMDDGRVAFSIYRRASEQPMFRIIKEPALQSRQGQWLLAGSAGQTLKRGRELSGVLDVLERKLLKVVAND
jgi:hypothetical protein